MKILFIAGRESDYVRNAIILKGLKENGVEIIECTSVSKSYPVRYVQVLRKFLEARNNKFDAIFIGFFGQPLVPIIRGMSSKPIIFDAFLSGYDTMCLDRGKFSPNSARGKFFYWLDKNSCELADKVILDTAAHADFFINTFDLKKEKFRRVFVGADDTRFYPMDSPESKSDTFKVFFYGSFLPLHGIEHIICAAEKLRRYSDIEFEIAGNGIEYEKIMRMISTKQIPNIKLKSWIPYDRLPQEISKADICLGGHFSSIDKSKRVISSKTFQFVAMEKPIIIGDNPANRELFDDRKNALLVEHSNPHALADAILELKEDNTLRDHIAQEGYETFKRFCTSKDIGKDIKEIIHSNIW